MAYLDIAYSFSSSFVIGSMLGHRDTRHKQFPNYITPTLMLFMSLGILYLFIIRSDPETIINTDSEYEEDNVYYQNCEAVRSTGEDPLYADEPGYRPALDRDNDGVTCEK